MLLHSIRKAFFPIFRRSLNRKFFYYGKKIGFLFVGAVILFTIKSYRNTKYNCFTCEDVKFFTRDEVKKHNNTKDEIWVTYGKYVYNITEFVDMHPGGKIIMAAAGKSLEPFYDKYSFHKTDSILEFLNPYLIGELEQYEMEEVNHPEMTMIDEYENDPLRDSRLIINSQKPFNAETPLDLLGQNFLTPNNIFFVRNHMPVPFCNPNKHTLTVCIQKKYIDQKEADKKPDDFYFQEEFKLLPNRTEECLCHRFSLDDLREFEQKSIVSVLQCSGNRREEMNKLKPVQGLSWKGGAAGNAKWSGVQMQNILSSCGLEIKGDVREAPGHARFIGADQDVSEEHYQASAPMHFVLDPSSIFAFQMNDEDIPLDHGFPLRAILPGITGARCVKWLEKVIIAEEEAQSRWQKEDYKCYPPNVNIGDKNKQDVSPIYEMPITSVICNYSDGSTLIPQLVNGQHYINVKGYAFTSGGKNISRVELSADGGNTWIPAIIEQPPEELKSTRAFYWTFWSSDIPVSLDKSDVQVICKAVDSSYNHQPESALPIWNTRGLLNNAWHKINIKLS